MPYLHRDTETGKVMGYSKWPNGSTERVADDAPEILAYNNPPELAPEDTPLSLEDVERYLVSQGVNLSVLKKGRPV